jgi:chromosome partitioning protein
MVVLTGVQAVAIVTSVLNMKGGVGKTTISLNLAYSLAKDHKSKVLIVDFDPQANASGGLMKFDEYEKHREKRKVISDIFTDLEKIVGPVSKRNATLLTLDDMKTRVKKFAGGGCIDLVPSELELSHVLERSGGSSFEDRLKLILKGKKNQYDFVIVDCGPTYSVLTNNALKASDFVLIPVKPDPFSARGIPLLLSKIEAHNRAHEGDDVVKVLGIVFSSVDANLVYETEVKERFCGNTRTSFRKKFDSPRTIPEA